MPDGHSASVWKAAEAAVVAGAVAVLDSLLHDHERLLRTERPQATWLGGLTPNYGAGDARAIVVREHHFTN